MVDVRVLKPLCPAQLMVASDQGCTSFKFNGNSVSWANLEPGQNPDYFCGFRVIFVNYWVFFYSGSFLVLILAKNLDPELFASWAQN